MCIRDSQYLDISFERRDEVSVDAYLEMIGKKTAALLGAAVQAGAILATDDDDVVEAYRRFGYDLGMAFQMADDVKGSFWSSAESGKPKAGDIRKRKKTMPVVWALEHAGLDDRDRLAELYRHPGPIADGRGPVPLPESPMNDDAVAEVLAILERSGARQEALDQAAAYRDSALRNLELLPCPLEHKRDLAALVRSVIST